MAAFGSSTLALNLSAACTADAECAGHAVICWEEVCQVRERDLLLHAACVHHRTEVPYCSKTVALELCALFCHDHIEPSPLTCSALLTHPAPFCHRRTEAPH